MGRSNRSDAEIVSQIDNLIAIAEAELSPHKNLWKEIYIQVYGGTSAEDLEEWRTRISLPDLLSHVENAADSLTSSLISRPNWYNLELRDPADNEARQLKEPLKKLMDYHIEISSFKSFMHMAILNSVMSIADIGILWKKKKRLNPAWILWKASQDKTAEDKYNEYNSLQPSDIAQQLQQFAPAISAVFGGGSQQNQEPEQHIEIGTLDYLVPKFDKTYWDHAAPTINDSRWRAAKIEMHDYEVLEHAESGAFDKEAAEEAVAGCTNGMVEITVYFGPKLAEEGGSRRVVEENYYCCYSGSRILCSGHYPYFELSFSPTPFASAVVAIHPDGNYGMSRCSYALELMRQLDHNWRIQCDQMQYGLLGLNVVNTQGISNREVLDEGIRPGSIIYTNRPPGEVFQRVELTSNRESQNHPTNEVLRNGVINSVGTPAQGVGGANLRSRTTTSEIAAYQNAAADHITTMAQMLQEHLIIPALKKILARIVQFGLDEVSTNPELRGVLNPAELSLLDKIPQQQRIRLLEQLYRIQVRSLDGERENSQTLQNLSELLTAAGNNPQFAAKINYGNLLNHIARLLNLDNLSLISEQPSEYDLIESENAILAAGRPVPVDPNDNHELHLQLQIVGPNSTPAQQQHAQEHQMMLQQLQQAQQSNMPN